MLKIENVSKDYGNGKGIKNVSFQIEKGRICALLGANGSGKTTTFRVLLGLLKPEGGALYYDNETIVKNQYRLFGYMSEERSLLRGLKVEEHVRYLARLKKMEDPEIDRNLNYWLSFLRIEKYRNTKIIELSKGNQQKVQLLCALIHNPEVLIFDEPLNGLDIENVELFKCVLMKLKKDQKIVLISSHQYQNIEHFCDQIVYLQDGQVLFQGAINTLKKKYEKRILTIHTKKEMFKNRKGILSSRMENEYQILEVENKKVGYKCIEELVRSRVEDFKFEMISLAEIIKEESICKN